MHNIKFEIILKKVSEGKYHAVCPTIPGCYTEGKTKKEALLKIEKAIMEYIEMALDWTSSGMMLAKSLKELEFGPEDVKSQKFFSMEVSMWDKNQKISQPQNPDSGLLGIPFSSN